MTYIVNFKQKIIPCTFWCFFVLFVMFLYSSSLRLLYTETMIRICRDFFLPVSVLQNYMEVLVEENLIRCQFFINSRQPFTWFS